MGMMGQGLEGVLLGTGSLVHGIWTIRLFREFASHACRVVQGLLPQVGSWCPWMSTSHAVCWTVPYDFRTTLGLESGSVVEKADEPWYIIECFRLLAWL